MAQNYIINRLSALFNYACFMPIRLLKTWKFVSNKKLSQTYYPEEKRKSKLRILIDQFWWMIKKGEVNYYYYLWGFDRLNVKTNEYLGRKEAWSYIKKAVTGIIINGEKINYRCILRDKFIFNNYISNLGVFTPKIYAVCDNEKMLWLENQEQVKLETIIEKDIEFICKPIAGFGGKGFLKIEIKDSKTRINGEICTLNELYSKIIGKCIFQEYITQEEKISKIYPHSLNTVRPVTVMDHGKPFLLTPFLRVGHQGSLVDNWAGGGVIIPIDKETGRLKKHGFLQPGTGTLVTKHPDTGMEFEGFEVPYYKEMVELIMKLHKLFYGIHSIGWDIAITANGPCVIEGNDEWDLALQQTFDNGLKQFYLHSYPIIDS